jgi:hypothetical protein
LELTEEERGARAEDRQEPVHVDVVQNIAGLPVRWDVRIPILLEAT